MNFNRFLLDNYLCTREGKKALAFFDKFEQNIRKKDCNTNFCEITLTQDFINLPPFSNRVSSVLQLQTKVSQ